MFGRIRASSSYSLDSFEEGPPSKIFKDDPLSIYEATLIKLKLGSRRDVPEMESDCSATTVPPSPMQFPLFGNSTNVSESRHHFATCSANEEEEAMAMDIGDRCCGKSKQVRGRNVSVVHLFSKYNNRCRDASNRELVSSSATATTSLSSSSSSTKEALDHESHTSSSSLFLM